MLRQRFAMDGMGFICTNPGVTTAATPTMTLPEAIHHLPYATDRARVASGSMTIDVQTTDGRADVAIRFLHDTHGNHIGSRWVLRLPFAALDVEDDNGNMLAVRADAGAMEIPLAPGTHQLHVMGSLQARTG